MSVHHPLHSLPTGRRGVRLGAWAVVLASALAGPAWAQATPNALQAWTDQARQWIQTEVGSASKPSTTSSAALALRPEIEVGALDSRLRLAPCQRVEPYLPQGTRLWGRSRIGLRCVEGPSAWNVFLPVTVRVWGPAWVIRQPVAPGTTLTQEHAELAEIDWAQSNTPVIAQPDDWIGRDATRALMPGQALRQGMVRSPQVFAAGSQVRVQAQGPGFALSATGEALSHGHVGEPARVRLPNRRVLTGTVRDAETVQINL